MNKEERLKKISEIVPLLKENEEKVIKNNTDIGHINGVFANNSFYYAIHAYYIENDINKSKDLFSLVGKYRLEQAKRTKGSRIFSTARTLISNVAISDNLDLIKEYNDFDYPISYVSRNKTITTSFKEWVEEGEEGSIYSKLIINAMNREITELEENLYKFKNITLKKKMNEKMFMDLEFYENLLKKDTNLIQSSIEKFLTKKEHKYRNQQDVFPELISYPAVGYLKIAQINGFNIRIDNELIPNELINSKPSDKYSEIRTVANNGYN
jgi:hypothetical protein